MIIHKFNIVRITCNKSKTYTPLVINGNRKEAFSVAFQFMPAIAWRHLQIVCTVGKINIFQLSRCTSGKIRRKPFCLSRNIQRMGMTICKGFNHCLIVTRNVTCVKQIPLSLYIQVDRAQRSPFIPQCNIGIVICVPHFSARFRKQLAYIYIFFCFF